MRFLMRAPDMAEEMVEQSSEKFTERYVCISMPAPFIRLKLHTFTRRHKPC